MPDLFVKRHARRSERPSSSAALASAGHAAMKVRLSAACRAHSYANELMVQSWAQAIGSCRDTELANTGCDLNRSQRGESVCPRVH
jgi:hypothetical protein